MKALPHVMRAVRLVRDGDEHHLEVREQAVPWPGAGQVLVRVAAAPIHPADRDVVGGRWGVRRPLPTTPGCEASGEVVATGGGLVGRWLVGRRVAMLARSDGDGTWAEYAIAEARHCLPLWQGILDEEAATLLLNPLTALYLSDAVRAAGGRGVLVTGGAGVLGQMLVRLARREGIAAVAVVRDAHQQDRVPEASEVLRMDDPELDARLRRAVRTWRIHIALDALGGPITGRMLSALPDGGSVVVHGLLGKEPASIDPADLVFRRKSVRGFWLPDVLGPSGLLQALTRLRRLHTKELRTEIGEVVRLADVPAALSRAPGAVRGRILVVPA